MVMAMGIEIEWIVGILRMGKGFKTASTRDKYDYSSTVIRCGDSLEIKGFSSNNLSTISKEEFRKVLKSLGIKTVTWEHNGRVHEEKV